MDDDFNTPVALSVIFTLLNKANKLLDENKINSKQAKKILEFFKMVDSIFSLDLLKIKQVKIPVNVKTLVKKREEYRKKANFELADKTRKEIKEMGYEIEDTKNGSKITKIKN